MTEPQEIHVLNKRVRLLQPRDGFRTSLDSVMLAAACPAKEGQSVLDLGCGVGGAGLCLLARVPDAQLTGVEIQPDHVELAVRNASLNGHESQCRFICADVRDYEGGRFDHVICNPPYLEAGTHTRSPKAQKATALGHGEANISLKDWVDAAFDHLKSKGSLTLIHRADMTDKIIQALGKRFGAVEIIPLCPRTGEAANRVIVRAVKDRRSPCTLQAGIVLHEANGDYTEETEAILRGMKAIA